MIPIPAALLYILLELIQPELLLSNIHSPIFCCLPSLAERLKEFEYRRVRLHGYFDHSKELHVWPRSLYAGEATPVQGRGSQTGANVVTPFFCEELGQFVLVNRGWVPKDKKAPSSRVQGQVCVCACVCEER